MTLYALIHDDRLIHKVNCKVVTLIRCGGLFCVSLVLHYLNVIPCKNYNYVFVFVKVMPKILLVPFFRTRCSWSMDASMTRCSVLCQTFNRICRK